MGKGKIAAQCAHAAIGCYKQALIKTPDYLRNWETFGQTTVGVKIDSLEALQELKVRNKVSPQTSIFYIQIHIVYTDVNFLNLSPQ